MVAMGGTQLQSTAAPRAHNSDRTAEDSSVLSVSDTITERDDDA